MDGAIDDFTTKVSRTQIGRTDFYLIVAPTGRKTVGFRTFGEDRKDFCSVQDNVT